MDKVIVALDNFNREDLLSFLDKYGKEITQIKIGLELFNAYGKDLIHEINNKYELEVFLDLKLHDIPSTVSKAIRSLEGLQIKFLTIHLSGGAKMVKEALWARDTYLKNTKILGVTVLTSLEENDVEQVYNTEIEKCFTNLYTIAKESRIDGVILSPHELSIAQRVDKKYQHNTLKVCPGIRLKDEDNQDQARVMEPKEAFKKGANYLVIGRSITTNPAMIEKLNKKI